MVVLFKGDLFVLLLSQNIGLIRYLFDLSRVLIPLEAIWYQIVTRHTFIEKGLLRKTVKTSPIEN